MKRFKVFCMIGVCFGLLGISNVSALENPYQLKQPVLASFQNTTIDTTLISSSKYNIVNNSIKYIDTKGDTDVATILNNVTVKDGYKISISDQNIEVTEGSIGQGFILRVVSNTDETDQQDYLLGSINIGSLKVTGSEISLSTEKNVADVVSEISATGFSLSGIKVYRQATEVATNEAIEGGDRLILSFVEGFEQEYVFTYDSTSISIDQSNMNLSIDDTFDLTTTIQKTNNSSIVTWESSDISIVTVDENGKITAKQPGAATISATLEGKTDTVDITVDLLVPKISSVTGNYGAAQINILEEGGATGYEIYRRLDSTGVEGETISGNFEKITETDLTRYTDTTVQVGYTYTYKIRSYYGNTIENRMYSGYSQEVAITISSLKIEGVTQNLKVGDRVTLTTNASEGEVVEWSSSNASIAEIDGNGLLVIKAPGTVDISAKTKTRQDSIKITIGLDTPTLNAVLTRNTVSLEISNVIGANQYHIYRKGSNESEYTEIYKGSSNTYIDQTVEFGKTYTYKAKASYDNGLYYIVNSEESTTQQIIVPTINIEQKDMSLKVDQKASLKAHVDGLPDTVQIAWISSKEEVVVVDGNGVVTAKRPGNVKIIATAGGIETSIDVTVTMEKPVINLSSTYNQVTLKANRVSGANGYDVYRSTSLNGKYVKQTTPTNLTYKNKVDTGTKYYYYIIAYYKGSNGTIYSEKSDVKTITPAMTKPIVKTYAWGYNTIKVVTGKVAGATGYDIYRAASLNGVYTKLKQPTQLTYYDKSKVTSKYNVNSGQTYYYKVIAYRTVNGRKIYSPTMIVTGKTVPAKAKVSLSRYNSKTIKVKWTKVAGASGYEIYRALSTNGKYTKIKTITKGSTLSYNDGKRMKGRRYYYKVRAYRTVSGKKIYGPFNNIPSYVLK